MRASGPEKPADSPEAGASGAPEFAHPDAWARFAAAESAAEFCQSWLAIQCEAIGDASAAMLLLEDEAGRYAPAAIWPERTIDVTGLGHAAEQALVKRQGIVLPLGGPGEAGLARSGAYVAYPVLVRERLYGAVVVAVPVMEEAALQRVLRALVWGSGWIETLFRRRAGSESSALLERRGAALAVLARASECREPKATALATVTDLATRLGCSTVALATFRPNGRLKLAALSHSAWFDERTKIVDAFENAMEEALDQARSVAVPAPEGAAATVALAHRDLLRLTGTRAALSVPLISAGRPVGAITLLRETDGARFEPTTIRIAETVGVLVGPLLAAQQEADRLFAGRLLALLRKGVARLFGPRRPALKLAAIAVLAGLVWLALATGSFQVTARAQVVGSVQQAAVAPFEGFLAGAPRRAGDRVKKGELLASLDDSDLALEAIRWKSEREQQLIRYQEAIGKHDRPQARISAALAAQAEAQLQLAEEKRARTRILAPFDGVIVSGDLSQMLGTPVERGKLLFEIAPVDAYRVILQVDERDIGQIRPGLGGHLVLTAFANERFPVKVVQLTPVAAAQDGRNSFRVEAELAGEVVRLRPGLEGIAKIDVETRSLLAIWTRPLVDYLRLTFWQWFG